jgi:hypothetical protein
MRAVQPVPALAIPAAVLLVASACTLLAPSDAELMGEAAEVTSPDGGREGDGPSGNSPSGGSGGAPTSEAGSSSYEEPSLPQGGDGAVGRGVGGTGSEDFSSLIPQDKLELWLMADHGIGLAEDGGVAVWADYSPSEADAKQSLAGLQPTIAAAVGDLPQMLEFDGVDDQLALPAGFNDFSAGLSVFIIASASDDLSCPSLLHLSNDPENQDIEVGRFHGSIHYEVHDDDIWGTENAFGLNQRVLLGVVHAPEQAPELRLNGVFMASGDFTALPVVTPRVNNFIGRSLYSGCELFHGKIGEIIVYARALTSAEREAVQSYLQSKWSYEPRVKTKPGPGEIDKTL